MQTSCLIQLLELTVDILPVPRFEKRPCGDHRPRRGGSYDPMPLCRAADNITLIKLVPGRSDREYVKRLAPYWGEPQAGSVAEVASSAPTTL